jgi:ketosteroid isomerase-like protein
VSDPGLDVIRDVYDALARGDLEAMAEHVDADVVWEHNLGVGSPEEGVYEGRESVVRLYERILEPWEYIRAEPRSIDQLEDGSYRVVGELHAKHRTSDTEVLAPYEQRLQVRDGLLTKGTMKTGLAQSL